MVSPHDKICKNMKTNEKCNSKEDVEKLKQKIFSKVYTVFEEME